MTFQYYSDLHLEFPENRAWLKQHPLIPSAKVLLLAGDILPLVYLHRYADFIDLLSSSYEAVYWIPGNHEYYGYDMASKPSPFIESIRSNVFLVNNKVVKYNNINLILSTLWSQISVVNEWLIQHSLSDFSAISYQQQRLSPSQFNQHHADCRAFIEKAIADASSQPTIVVTHHVPTLLNYPKKYIHSPISEAFVVELHHLIESSAIDYWIYGHHHYNTPAFKIGKTTLLTNQLGYIAQREQSQFNYRAVIEIQQVTQS